VRCYHIFITQFSTESVLQDNQRLLKHLESEAYVELFASPIAGVGVRAFRPIPAGVDPFPICNMHMAAKERFCVCSDAELKAMPPGVFEKVKSFFAALTEDDGWTPQRNRKGEIIYGVLSTGMNNLNLSWYLNHSDDPNIEFCDAEEDGGYNSFVTRHLMCKAAISTGFQTGHANLLSDTMACIKAAN